METTDPSGQNLENTGEEFVIYFHDFWQNQTVFWADLCQLTNHGFPIVSANLSKACLFKL